ncbi:sugar phosphate isomerase/epimerase family protein [Geodermatophilus sp. SYSU D00815]
MTEPRISISCPTTYTATIEEDIRNYHAAGATGIGLWEYKLDGRDDGAVHDLMQEHDLVATLCCAKVPSVIPDPFFAEPADPGQRVEAMKEAVRRFARFRPAGILVTTGEPGGYDPAEARRIVVDGVRQVAETAGELGITLGLEPYRQTSGTLVTTLVETLEMVDEIGAPNVQVIMDTWHFWDIPGIHADLEKYADRLVGVQLNDWREPTRNWCDRVLPGDGTIDLRAVFRALEAGGFDGWYDIEVFSDNGLFGNDYPDSVWHRPADEVSRAAVAQTLELWRTRHDAA